MAVTEPTRPEQVVSAGDFPELPTLEAVEERNRELCSVAEWLADQVDDMHEQIRQKGIPGAVLAGFDTASDGLGDVVLALCDAVKLLRDSYAETVEHAEAGTRMEFFNAAV